MKKYPEGGGKNNRFLQAFSTGTFIYSQRRIDYNWRRCIFIKSLWLLSPEGPECWKKEKKPLNNKMKFIIQVYAQLLQWSKISHWFTMWKICGSIAL